LMTPDAYGRIAVLGDRVARGIETVFDELGEQAQVTGLASLRRVHFVPGNLTDYRSAYPSAEARTRSKLLYDGLMVRGFMIGPAGLMSLSTAVTEAEVDQLIAAVRDVLRG
jgi:glutamate-1-semialdehyde 2,1-aminomutase